MRSISYLIALLVMIPTAIASESILIDVRSKEEFAMGHIQNAHHIPYQEIGEQISMIAPDKESEILLYCRSGRRAEVARSQLIEMGYVSVRNLGGLESAEQVWRERQAIGSK